MKCWEINCFLLISKQMFRLKGELSAIAANAFSGSNWVKDLRVHADKNNVVVIIIQSNSLLPWSLMSGPIEKSNDKNIWIIMKVISDNNNRIIGKICFFINVQSNCFNWWFHEIFINNRVTALIVANFQIPSLKIWHNWFC